MAIDLEVPKFLVDVFETVAYAILRDEDITSPDITSPRWVGVTSPHNDILSPDITRGM